MAILLEWRGGYVMGMKRLSMRKSKEILRLCREIGLSVRKIAHSQGVARSTRPARRPSSAKTVVEACNLVYLPYTLERVAPSIYLTLIFHFGMLYSYRVGESRSSGGPSWLRHLIVMKKTWRRNEEK
jgi:hypothetical protein